MSTKTKTTAPKKAKKPAAKTATAKAKATPVRESPRSVLRVMHILNCLAEHPDGCNLATLSAELGAPKSSLLNLLRGLISSGYLADPRGAYVLGPESHNLALSILGSVRPSELMHLVLVRLSERTGDTALLATMSEDGKFATLIDKCEPQSVVRLMMAVGEVLPLYCSATGRAMMAYWAEKDIDAYLNRIDLLPLTPNTQTDTKAIKAELANIRRQGHAVTFDQFEPGLAGIAVPVFNGSGKAVQAVVVAGPTERIRRNLKSDIELAKQAAGEISRLHGFQD